VKKTFMTSRKRAREEGDEPVPGQRQEKRQMRAQYKQRILSATRQEELRREHFANLEKDNYIALGDGKKTHEDSEEEKVIPLRSRPHRSGYGDDAPRNRIDDDDDDSIAEDGQPSA